MLLLSSGYKGYYYGDYKNSVADFLNGEIKDNYVIFEWKRYWSREFLEKAISQLIKLNDEKEELQWLNG